MKILLIDTLCNSGSTGKIAYNLYSGMKRLGHESAIAYGRGKLIDDANIYRFSPKWEVYLHAALTRLTGITGCYSPIATRRLLKFIKRFSPDVVHLHNIHGYYLNDCVLLNYLKKSNIRTVITLHDEWLYTGKCAYTYDCDAWQHECKNCPQVKEYPASLFFDKTRAMYLKKKRIFEGFDNLTLVTPSEWLANRVKQSFLKDKHIVVIPNGIDTDIFKPMDTSDLQTKYSGAAKKVLHVTPNFEDKRKGGKYVLELAKRMPDISFFIVGNKKPIKNLPQNAHAVGRTENQVQLAQWYSFADITLLTSEKETFSMVCAESLACGTPIVGFDAGAPIEVAPEGYGVFTPYGDISALELILLQNMNNKEQCAEFGRANYDYELMAKRYESLYKYNKEEDNVYNFI